MIHAFPATLHSTRTSFQDGRLTFAIEKEIVESIQSMLSKTGKQYLLVAYEIGEESKEIVDAHNDLDSTRKHLLSKVHAIMGDYSKTTNVSIDKIKQLLKLKLKSRKAPCESLSELDESGVALAVFILQTDLSPTNFNYNEYL